MNVLELRRKLTNSDEDERSVLLIERDPERLRNTAAIFERFGHEVVLAATVKEANTAINIAIENQLHPDTFPIGGIFFGSTLPVESVGRIMEHLHEHHLLERGEFTILTNRSDMEMSPQMAERVRLQRLSSDVTAWAGSLAAYNPNL